MPKGKKRLTQREKAERAAIKKQLQADGVLPPDTARLGEFVDVLYRIAGRPETDNTALPADYENEEFNATHPYYNAVCWAYQTRLLRQNDPNAEYDDKVDYQTACVLIRRYAIMAGVDTRLCTA